MTLKSLLWAAALALGALLPAAPASAVPEPVLPARIVMTWVPPYSRDVSAAALRAKYNKYSPSNSLTHLGLQFWVPTSAGGVALVQDSDYGTISSNEIKTYVDWAHGNGIKVMLTVYNGYPQWDWALAKNAFGAHRKTFVKALVAEMEARNLDGVDIDLEGPGIDPTPDDKTQYVTFLKSLATEVHAKGKLVQVDSFHYIYNAPNQTWWPSLFKIVDQLATMGYEDLGRNAPTWQSYDAQASVAVSKANKSKLIIGVPSYLNEWQGDDAVSQISWFSNSHTLPGVGIWDAQFTAAPWQDKTIWSLLKHMRERSY